MSSYFDSQNAAYVQALYEDFTRNPEAVHPEWREFFRTRRDELRNAGLQVVDGRPAAAPARAPDPAPAALPTPAPTRTPDPSPPTAPTAPAPSAPPTPDSRLLSLVARASNLLQAFREHGHQAARIDPLGSTPPGHPQLDPAYFGTTMDELEEIPTSVLFPEGGEAPLAFTLDRLKAIYGGDLGYEFEHLEDPVKVAWLWEQVERGTHFDGYSDEDRLRTLDRLTQVEGLEQFLHRAYLGQKRFSIEGIDMLVPMLDE
ncbi:MAG: hypothetical protein OXQ93_08390, partial [Gemmatimonadota bacterium]|nr:hypothetical protein [Gemmatimonadota bacterium]